MNRWHPRAEALRWADRFGIRDSKQVKRDLMTLVRGQLSGTRFSSSLSTLGMFRPDLSIPAYRGQYPSDRVAPVLNFFDRVEGGRNYESRVTRDKARDWRGGRLTYDQHDGTDFVCPIGTDLVAAAPGVAVAIRDTWLRGGLTLCVDHGDGVITQYTHLSRVVVGLGEVVKRGQIVARSGVSGFDMLIGAPWVPPHVHFLVSCHGTPTDPYVVATERVQRAVWAHGNEPRTIAAAMPDDAELDLEKINAELNLAAIGKALEGCLIPQIRKEIELTELPAGQVAVIEDSLHHERHAWAPWVRDLTFRKPGQATNVRLTLPLPADRYDRAEAVDAVWTH